MGCGEVEEWSRVEFEWSRLEYSRVELSRVE